MPTYIHIRVAIKKDSMGNVGLCFYLFFNCAIYFLIVQFIF